MSKKYHIRLLQKTSAAKTLYLKSKVKDFDDLRTVRGHPISDFDRYIMWKLLENGIGTKCNRKGYYTCTHLIRVICAFHPNFQINAEGGDPITEGRWCIFRPWMKVIVESHFDDQPLLELCSMSRLQACNFYSPQDWKAMLTAEGNYKVSGNDVKDPRRLIKETNYTRCYPLSFACCLPIGSMLNLLGASLPLRFSP